MNQNDMMKVGLIVCVLTLIPKAVQSGGPLAALIPIGAGALVWTVLGTRDSKKLQRAIGYETIVSRGN